MMKLQLDAIKIVDKSEDFCFEVLLYILDRSSISVQQL